MNLIVGNICEEHTALDIPSRAFGENETTRKLFDLCTRRYNTLLLNIPDLPIYLANYYTADFMPIASP